MSTRPILRLPSRRAETPTAPEPAADHFFFLWRDGGYRPSKRHATRETVLAEAERLRQLYPRETFYVYEARALVEAPEQK